MSFNSMNNLMNRLQEQQWEFSIISFPSKHFYEKIWNRKWKILNCFWKTWITYVDNILAILYKSFNVEVFLENLSSQYSSTKFTSEKEVERRLSFLDQCIKRTNGILEFEIYRKKTHTYRYIKNSSNHFKSKTFYLYIWFYYYLYIKMYSQLFNI